VVSVSSRALGGTLLKTQQNCRPESVLIPPESARLRSKGIDIKESFVRLPDPPLIQLLIQLRDAVRRAFFDKSAVGMPRGCSADLTSTACGVCDKRHHLQVMADEHPL
jgi:hypothetical protein